MNFIQTENFNLQVPSKDNLIKWTELINSPEVRKTILSTLIPKTPDMQWSWLQNELNSKKRILLEICNKESNFFLGVISLSNIDHERRSAQIATISIPTKNKKNRYCVYESRNAVLKYAFNELSLNKVYGAMAYPENKSFLINNMCMGFEVEGLNHARRWVNNRPLMNINYFITKSIFEKKKIIDTEINFLLSKKNRSFNEEKLLKIISYLQIT